MKVKLEELPPGAFAKALGTHGANPEKLYKALNIAMPEKVLDFSTNASVVAWNNDLSKFDWFNLARNYPDYECIELRNLIAQREGVRPENILFVNGSNEAFYIIASYLANKRVAILQPAYSEYERALKAYNAECVDIYNLNELANCEAIFFSNPCNPNGNYIEPDELLNLINLNKDVLFVIDEAYIDFLLYGNKAHYDFDNLNNVVVTRSLTKFYHLSGLRIGYILSSENIINKLKARQPIWSVNAAAQALTLEFLRDRDFELKSLEFYKRETPRFINALKDLGYCVNDTRANFFIIDLAKSNIKDEDFIVHMLRRGVVVRHTRNFKSLDGNFVRAATRLESENNIFIEAAREFMKNDL
ncbi:MAG: aminotransferase class I/II-fold pyridoxal phosphate-dependent enzyme [Synergistaceae bacterium]|nr:aminotransferase class I/II-fold pyridoxal phosphate-dependent enzyme [Synergistaceae bacterium]MBR0097231.1 aminotransferase class I/II-fold pyridoxal phosphate-dependent enzyme [Synergistaceae bacterium]